MPTATRNSDPVSGPPAPSREQISNCIFSSWYENYKKHCPKTRVIKPLPKEFIDYLLSDGVHLPHDDNVLQWENTSENGDEDWDNDDGNEAEQVEDPTLKFPELHAKIESTVRELGAVAPKMNWSAPRDAAWISTTSNMKCVNASDIYLLLNSSSYIVHDLTQAFDDCHDYSKDSMDDLEFELVLRKWVDFNPSMEFRCFVKDRELVGVTQRDMNYYDFLEPIKEDLHDVIDAFFDRVLKTTFPDSSFVFDVYIPRPFDRAWLVDINPWAVKTDTHLFSWEQLANIDPLRPEFDAEFRLVDKMDSSRGFGSVEHTESAVPMDFVEASMTGQGISDLVRQMQSELRVQERDD